MKILLLSSTNNINNGYGNLTHQYCSYFKKVGLDFKLLLPVDAPRYTYADYPIEYVLPKYIFDMKNFEVLKYLTFKYKTDADVVHSITEFPYALLAAKIARANGRPLIIEAAGTYGVKPLLQFPDKFFLTRAYNRAKFIVAMSRFTADMIQKYSGTKTPVRIIHPGLDLSRFDTAVDLEAVNAIKEKYGNKKLLLTVGVLKPRKGHDVILKALSLLKNRDDFHYLIVGPDNEGRDTYRISLNEIIKQNNLEKKVTFVGQVSEIDLVKYFQASYLYVHTPRIINWNFEGFGIVYLEAGASRKPVVAAASGGVTDAVIDGKTGIVVPENDIEATAKAISSLLDNPTKAESMGRAGHQFALEHDWPIIAAKYVELYKEIINK